MRILVVTQYFWPESFLINDLAKALSAQGHDVTVATGKPNYPAGEVMAGYTRHGVVRETYAGTVEVIRVPLRPRGKSGAVRLALNYLSFVFSGLRHFPGLLRGRQFDVVFVFGVSPITAAIPAILLAWLKRAPLCIWIQDLWPESLSATGFVKNRAVLWLVGLMVRAIYACASTLLLQSEAFAGPVGAYADPRKFVCFPNPAPEAPEAHKPGRPLPAPLQSVLSDGFRVVFAGNLGKAQSLETIIEAATLLRDEPHIRFVIVGAGSEAEMMRREIEARGLAHVSLTGPVAREDMPAVYRHASALLVTLGTDPSLSMVVPSKVQACLQAGKPIVAAVNGEAARILREAGSGPVVPAGDAPALATAILHLATLPPATHQSLGTSARRTYEANYELHAAAGRLAAILERAVARRGK